MFVGIIVEMTLEMTLGADLEKWMGGKLRTGGNCVEWLRVDFWDLGEFCVQRLIITNGSALKNSTHRNVLSINKLSKEEK